jgi:hypothetical protein
MYPFRIGFALLLAPALCVGQEKPADPPPQGNTVAPARGDRSGRNGVFGKITAMSGASVTLKTPDGQDAQVTLTEKTQYSKDRQPVKLTDFQVGDMAFVRGKSTGANTWEAEMLASRSGAGGDFREGLGKRFIAGEIKSIDATSLTIARPDGVSQTIKVDEDTSFKKKGESATLGDLAVGDHVFGRGALKGDVFVPAVLNVGDPGAMRDRQSNPAGDVPH